MEGTAQMRAELKHAMVDLHDDDRRVTDKVGWFDWMNLDIEEHAELKRKERLKNVLDSLPKKMRVPPKYMPSFWSLLGLGILVTLHLLVVLLQHWSVAFQILLNYNLVSSSSAFKNLPDDDEYNDSGSHKQQQYQNKGNSNVSSSSNGKAANNTFSAHLSQTQILARRLPTHVRVTPSGKKDVLLPIVYQPTLGPTFEYHRRKFVWDEENYWRKVRCFTKMKVSFFEKWQGYASEEQIHMAQMRYGNNIFDVKQPSFTELYQAQLTSPFTVFQLFCVVLWMLDEYWQYSAFTLFMILTFEAMVVFSRIKSLAALRGMGNKSRIVHVFRNRRWIPMPSHDMVPADVLLLCGFTVVNEASLTGESVPQMKEGLIGTIQDGEEEELLSIKGKDKNHVLYAGTKLLQCKLDVPPSSENKNNTTSEAMRLLNLFLQSEPAITFLHRKTLLQWRYFNCGPFKTASNPSV
jgi:cation-transporting ATPase 13A1